MQSLELEKGGVIIKSTILRAITLFFYVSKVTVNQISLLILLICLFAQHRASDRVFVVPSFCFCAVGLERNTRKWLKRWYVTVVGT